MVRLAHDDVAAAGAPHGELLNGYVRNSMKCRVKEPSTIILQHVLDGSQCLADVARLEDAWLAEIHARERDLHCRGRAVHEQEIPQSMQRRRAEYR